MRKKLFAILMSAMMMVTFMPAMAFAALDDTKLKADYASDYSAYEMSYNGGVTVSIPTTRCFNTSTGRTEVVIASADATKAIAAAQYYTEGVREDLLKKVPTGSDKKVEYYDLTGAKMEINNGTFATSLNWLDADKDANFKKVNLVNYYAYGNERLVLAQPAEVKSYKATGTEPASGTGKVSGEVTLNKKSGSDWTLRFVVTGWDPTNKGAQTVTVTPDIDGAVTTDVVYKLVGSVDPATIAVAAKTLDEDDIDFYTDTVTEKKLVTVSENDAATAGGQYDGASHKIVNTTVDGYTVTYKKWDSKKAAYVEVPAIEWKNATTADLTYKAVVTKDSTKAVVREVIFTLSVAQATASVQFVVNDAKTTTNEFKVAENYDVMDYIEVAPKVVGGTDPNENEKKLNKANAAAAKADEATIMAFFAEYYDVTQKAKKFDASYVDAAIVDKTFETDAAKKAVETKYKDLLANYTDKFEAERDTAVFKLDKEIDIEWVKAPLTKKYYNKKGKLAKTYTFAVEAKADSKVTYKLTNGGEMIKIDKNTGKVTVKKGLKVGTYKVYVTAKAGGSTEFYTLTIKMAKNK